MKAMRSWIVPVAVALAFGELAPAQTGCETNRATISAQRGIIFEPANVSSGQWYWKLVDAAWCTPEAGGLKINIFYKVKDANGNYISNQPCAAAWPYTYPNLPANKVTIYTKASPDWGDFPMSGGNWCPSWPTVHGPYSAWVESACPANGSSCPSQASYPSDRVWGMGLPCNYHECYYLTWQFTQAPPPPNPIIVRDPVSFTRTVRFGQNLPDDSFTVQNGGGGTLSFTVSENATWLSVTPTSGTATGSEVRTITIHYGTVTLAVGSYIAIIQITGNATNPSETVQVNLTVEPPSYKGDMDGDGDVDQEDFGKFQVCMKGEGVIQDAPACLKARLDEDVDVDQADVTVFRACMSGASKAASESCLR